MVFKRCSLFNRNRIVVVAIDAGGSGALLDNGSDTGLSAGVGTKANTKAAWAAERTAKWRRCQFASRPVGEKVISFVECALGRALRGFRIRDQGAAFPTRFS
jgi:hypothetical protein